VRHKPVLTSAAQPDKPAEPPRFSGPRGIAGLVPAITRPAFRKRAPATAQLLSDWAIIVGPAIAAVSAPKKLLAGSLAIGCTGPIAMELQHLAPELLQRINGHFGQVIVTRLRFVQDFQVAPATTPVVRKLAVAAARLVVADLPEGALRDALLGLGQHVLAKPSTRSGI
jgi:hypothetical protein